MKIKFIDEVGEEVCFSISYWSAMKIFIAGYFGWFVILLLIFLFIYLFTTL